MADQIEDNLPDAEPVVETIKESGSALDKYITAALDKNEAPELGESKAARDEKGRFAEKNTELDGEKPKSEVSTEQQATEIKPVETQPLEPHARWSADLKTQFASWPRNVQETFLARHNEVEANLTRKTQEIADFRKSAEPLVQAVQPFGEYLNGVAQSLGTSPPALVHELLKTEYALRTGTQEQKASALASIAREYGINLASLAGPSADGSQSYQPDPFVSQLYQTMPAVQREIAELRQFKSQLETDRIVQEVEAFSTARDEHGNAKHPYYEDVKPQLAALLQSGQASTLAEAYAIVTKPFEKVTQQQQASRQQADEQARKAAVEKARKASPVRSNGSAPRGTSQAKGLDGVLSSALDGAGFN